MSNSMWDDLESAVYDALLDRLLDAGDVLPAHVESMVRLDRDGVVGYVSREQSEFYVCKRDGNILCEVCMDEFLPHVHHMITSTNDSFVLYTIQDLFGPLDDIMNHG